MRLWQITAARSIGNLLIIIALSIFAWLIWLNWGTGFMGDGEQDQTVSEVRKQLDALEDPVIQTSPEQPAPHQPSISSQQGASSKRINLVAGEAFGIITIPRFGDDFAAPLLESTDADTLTRGVGHYSSTASPCAVGNFSLAGHRTTYGRPFYDIDRLNRGDKIVIETTSGSCIYQVDSHQIVEPAAVEVLAPVPNRPSVKPTQAWLTMTACHPKYSAAKRYVVFAKLVATN